jgi:adenylate kinase family enzyme
MKRALRIVIAGGPRTGKTTVADALAEKLRVPLRHTDDLIERGWVEAGAAVAEWLDLDGPWIVEGVAAPRALRRWLKRHRRGRPCDVIAFFADAVIPRTPRQDAMAKGCATTYRAIRRALLRRGVREVAPKQLARLSGRRSRAGPGRAARSKPAARSRRRSRA